MPKIIDHQTKKLDIAHAARKILLKEGIGAASVRNIAKEAGITLGALRYYFTTQVELLSYIEDLVHAELSERTTALFMDEKPPLEKILNVLVGLLPEEGGNTASEARLIFKMHAKYSPKPYDRGRDSVYLGVRSILSNLVMLNLLKKDVDLAMETDRLYALMDGLAMDIMLRGSELKPDHARYILEAHIQSVSKKAGGG